MLHFTFVVSSLLSTDFFLGKRTSFTFYYFQILLLFPEPFPWFGRGREKAPFPAPPQAREKALGKRLPVPDTNVVSLKFKFSNYYKISQLRTFERNFPNIDFFSLNFHHCKMMSLLCQKCEKKNGRGGLPTSFWREHAQKNTLNLKKSGVVSE